MDEVTWEIWAWDCDDTSILRQMMMHDRALLFPTQTGWRKLSALL